MNLVELQAARQSPNVEGFLRLIRQGESNQDDSAYTILFGGDHFDSFADHPRRAVTKGSLTSTAAGAYQILAKTWDGLVRQYGFSDFSPASQDLAAVALIAGRGALQLVLDGRCREAIARCAREWASLPGSPYGQPTLSLKDALDIYHAYGGQDQATQAIPEPKVEAKAEVKPMGALLPLILQMIPSLISVFGSPNDSEVAKRNQAAGVLVADTLVKATQANNLADAVGKMQSDPGMLQAATDAVHELLPQLMDVGGGVESARKFAADHENSRYGRILEVVTYSALFFLLLANVGAFAFAWKADDFSVMADIKQADIGVALIAFGYWLGTSISSKRKDEMKGAQ